MKNTVDYIDHLRLWRKSQVTKNSIDYREYPGILRTSQIMMNSVGYIDYLRLQKRTVYIHNIFRL